MSENSAKFICISSNSSKKKLILEKLFILSYGLYYIIIKTIETYVVSNQKFFDPKAFMF